AEMKPSARWRISTSRFSMIWARSSGVIWLRGLGGGAAIMVRIARSSISAASFAGGTARAGVASCAVASGAATTAATAATAANKRTFLIFMGLSELLLAGREGNKARTSEGLLQAHPVGTHPQ